MDVVSIMNNDLDREAWEKISTRNKMLICEYVRQDHYLRRCTTLALKLIPQIPISYTFFHQRVLSNTNVAKAVVQSNPAPLQEFSLPKCVLTDEAFVQYIFTYHPDWVPALPSSHGMMTAFLKSETLLNFVMAKIRRQDYPVSVLANVPLQFLMKYAEEKLNDRNNYLELLNSKQGVSALPLDVKRYIGVYLDFITSKTVLGMLQNFLIKTD